MLIASICHCQSLLAAIQISENTAQRFAFSWEIQGNCIYDSTSKLCELSFNDENVVLGDSGQPRIPAFSFYVGVPPQGNVIVHVTPMKIRTIQIANSLRRGRGDPRIKHYPNILFDNSWISNALPCTFGQLKANWFLIKPFIYEENSNTIQVLEKAEVTILFPNSQPNSNYQPSITSDFQTMISRLLLNYIVAKTWAKPLQPLAKQKVMEEFPLAPTKPMISFKIGDGHDDINEGTINENGIIKISGAELIKILGTPLQINRLACFASIKGESPVPTPAVSELPDGITELPLMHFDLNKNGIVDPEDYVLLYVSGTSDWAFDTLSHQYYYNLNRFDDYRHYWIMSKISGNGASFDRMPTIAAPVTIATTSFQNHILFKKPLIVTNRGAVGDEGGLDWYWQKLSSSSPQFEYPVSLPFANKDFPIQVKIHVDNPFSVVTFGAAVICSTGDSAQWYSANYPGDNTPLKITSNIKGNAYTELKQIECKYTTDLDMSAGRALTVFSPETPGIVRYTLSNLPKQTVYIFRIGKSETIRLVDSVQGQQNKSWTDSAGIGITYFICPQSAILSAPNLDAVLPMTNDVVIHDLRKSYGPAANNADFIVVSHHDFLEQAIRLANHKKGIGRFSNPKVVDIADIYREFSGGVVDPAALRNFLVYVTNQWGIKPGYVVLLGKGHYNYKMIKTTEPVYIPVGEFSGNCIEDYFTYLDPKEDPNGGSPTPDIFIGRLPCTTLPQASQMVDKIINYEDPQSADLGAWRDRVVMVNDDDMQGSSDDELGTKHLEASEYIANKIISVLRPSVDMRKINLFEYPWNEILYKPEARAALIGEINNGAAFVNYFGHGSNTLFADERILDPDALANLNNYKRYPLISAFSCSVGHFDRPETRSLAEAMVLASRSGAIATISATRRSGSDENEDLASAFYKPMFDSTQTGVTFGQAYFAAKAQVFSKNSQIYALFSDPSLQPANSVRDISFEILGNNGKSINTLKALQSITIRGTIHPKGVSSPDANFGSASKPASLQLSIFNPPYQTTRKDKGKDQSVSYSLPGTPLFTGSVSVKNGTFEQAVHLPKKVTFNKTGAKAIAFAWAGTDNALGYKNVLFNGSDTGSADSSGPVIAIRQLFNQVATSGFGNTSVQSYTSGKIQALLPFSCEISCFDNSGIDIVGTGPDEGLTIEIPGVLSKQSINSKFRFSDGDYRKGTANYDFSEGMIRSGTYTMKISSQDLVGNVTRKDFTLEISQTQDLTISQVFNFPNPMKMGASTTFYYNLSKTSGISSTIKIYTLSGKLIRVFNTAYSGQLFDGRDQMGNVLGPKVYLYQVVAVDNSPSQQKTVKSGIQKLVVHPPR